MFRRSRVHTVPACIPFTLFTPFRPHTERKYRPLVSRSARRLPIAGSAGERCSRSFPGAPQFRRASILNLLMSYAAAIEQFIAAHAADYIRAVQTATRENGEGRSSNQKPQWFLIPGPKHFSGMRCFSETPPSLSRSVNKVGWLRKCLATTCRPPPHSLGRLRRPRL